MKVVKIKSLISLFHTHTSVESVCTHSLFSTEFEIDLEVFIYLFFLFFVRVLFLIWTYSCKQQL